MNYWIEYQFYTLNDLKSLFLLTYTLNNWQQLLNKNVYLGHNNLI